MTKTYTRWTAVSAILCMLAVTNLAIHLMTMMPQWITPFLSGCAVVAGVLGKDRDPGNPGVHVMTVRIGLGCAALSGLLSLAVAL
ncbi:hypothetical protein [Streptomyces griseomycini]|uniref:Uncharacterized protein n=1 Tax=Streptomyces griseomycini TaxID=66895 RepID=A0A7W7PNJ4_9ACTN|nr:hypothetical protein [Streptomyces griseomycini]MBB4897501.1 hypothetical protein [Streptomyces griseomycini]